MAFGPLVGTEILISVNLDEEQKETVKLIKNYGKEAAKVVDELVILARIETRTLESEIVSVELPACINRALEILKFEERIKEQQLSLNVEILDIPKVLADEFQLSETLFRLLENAYLYREINGKITLTAEKCNGFVIVSVIDSGIGIAPENKDLLFKKFYRAPEMLVRDHQGLGLGLYFAKYYVENFGGEIGVESEQGKGSTFWFTLPISE